MIKITSLVVLLITTLFTPRICSALPPYRPDSACDILDLILSKVVVGWSNANFPIDMIKS